MRTRAEELATPLSALIDVVFLLIIFFVVTAKVQQETVDPQVKLAPTYHVKPDPPDVWTFTINLRQDDQGEVICSVRGQDCSIETVQQLLEAEVGRRGTQMPIIIRAGAGVRYGEVDDLVNRITSVGISRVMHATEAHFE